MASAPYRLYLRSSDRIVCRHEFAAENDAEAIQIAEQLAAAASDACDSFEVWQSARTVAWSDGRPLAAADGSVAGSRAMLVAAAEAILCSEWEVARSARLGRRLARWRQHPDTSLLGHVIRGAVLATGADTGNIQIVDGPDRLRIAAQHGLEREFLDFFAVVEQQNTSCGHAAKRARRVIVEDVIASPIFAGTSSGAVLSRAGLRSTYSTPLVVHGSLRGVLSTHRRAKWRPDAAELRLIDRFASDAAALMEL